MFLLNYIVTMFYLLMSCLWSNYVSLVYVIVVHLLDSVISCFYTKPIQLFCQMKRIDSVMSRQLKNSIFQLDRFLVNKFTVNY